MPYLGHESGVESPSATSATRDLADVPKVGTVGTRQGGRTRRSDAKLLLQSDDHAQPCDCDVRQSDTKHIMLRIAEGHEGQAQLLERKTGNYQNSLSAIEQKHGAGTIVHSKRLPHRVMVLRLRPETYGVDTSPSLYLGARRSCGYRRHTEFSDEAAQSNRDNVARDSEMMSPGVPG